MPLETFGDCINEVLNFGFNDGPQVNRKRVENWVNEAQFEIAREVEGPEYQTTEVMHTKQGTFKYALPEGFMRVQDIFFPELYTRLRPADLQQFDTQNPKLVEGPPAWYTLYATEVWFFPNPSQEYELEFRYLKEPPILKAESDTPVLGKRYLYLLVDYALVRAFKAEDDIEAAQAHKGEFKERLDRYASDVQTRSADRPRNVDGTWSGRGFGIRGAF